MMALATGNMLSDFGHVPSLGFESTFDSMVDEFETNSDSIDDGFWDVKSPQSLSDTNSPHPFEALLDCDLEPTIDVDTQQCNFDLYIEQLISDAFSYSPSAAVCDCSALKLKCSVENVNPVLRDCMWSGTSGLIPLIVSADGQPCVPLSSSTGNSSDSSCKMSGHVADSCSICTSCVSQTSTSMCVDPRSVFPYPECRPQTANVNVKEERCRTPPVTSISTTCSTIYDPDSETSAYSSAVSDEEPEEIDVVSVPLSSLNGSSSSRLSSPTSSPSQLSSSHVASMADRREMLVLPASESVSAQVAAMHNYSSTRCRPATCSSSSSSTSSPLSSHSLQSIKRRYAKRPAVIQRRSRHHAAMTYSGSDSSEDSWANGDNEDDRCRRAQHNVMERRRRHHLKGNFFRLRDAIPDIAGDGRVSKVAILCRAREHIGRLASTERTLQAEYDQLCAAQTKLKWQLSLVQREQRLTNVGS